MNRAELAEQFAHELLADDPTGIDLGVVPLDEFIAVDEPGAAASSELPTRRSSLRTAT